MVAGGERGALFAVAFAAGNIIQPEKIAVGTRIQHAGQEFRAPRDEIQRFRLRRAKVVVRHAFARLVHAEPVRRAGKQRARQQPGHGVRLVFHFDAHAVELRKQPPRFGQQPVVQRAFQAGAGLLPAHGVQAQHVEPSGF